MRDTPRTEVYVLDPLPQVVSADWARQLERELNAAKARCKRLEEAGDAMAIYAKLGGIPLQFVGVVNAWIEAKEDEP